MKQYLRMLIALLGLFSFSYANSQICSNPSGVIYGLAYSGLIYPITVSNASVGSPINTAYGSPNQADAMGYNPLNGYFYFFNGSTSPNQFVSYNPLTTIYSPLAACPAGSQVVSACVTPDGFGLYARDNNANLFYYNIVSNIWTSITSTYYDPSGTNITATIQGISTGGDMAFDANGNLILVFSSFNKYGVYILSGAVPKTSVASLTIKQILPPTTATPDNSIIAGIAFNITGQIYLSTIFNHLYLLNNNLTTTLLGSFSTNGVGIDLTSCNFPTSVLPVNFIQFNIEPNENNSLNLNWTVAQKGNTQYYIIQESTDANKWQEIGKLNSDNSQGMESYSYNAGFVVQGNHYYRICEVDMNGQLFYSETKMIKTNNTYSIGLFPNPASSSLSIQNNNLRSLKMQMFDPLGRCVKEGLLQPGNNNINISLLPKNSYLISVQNESGGNTTLRFIKE